MHKMLLLQFYINTIVVPDTIKWDLTFRQLSTNGKIFPIIKDEKQQKKWWKNLNVD